MIVARFDLFSGKIFVISEGSFNHAMLVKFYIDVYSKKEGRMERTCKRPLGTVESYKSL